MSVSHSSSSRITSTAGLASCTLAADIYRLTSLSCTDLLTALFRALMVATSNDHYITADRSRALARDWNCGWHNLGAHGHINAASGLGDWPEGRDLLARAATMA